MKEQVSSILDERYYEIDHPTGLKIFVMPKAHYRPAYAVIGTKYGSIDNRFKRSDAAEYTEVPEGIAHFLEHKLFESEELMLFSALRPPVRLPMRILPLTRLAICSSAVTALTSRWRFCWTLCSTRTLRLKRWRKSRELSARRSPCTMMYPAG